MVATLGRTRSAIVYTRAANTWAAQQTLELPDDIGTRSDSYIGDVAIDGDTIVISANADRDFTGLAYVFAREEQVWTFRQTLTPPGGAPRVDDFGHSIDIDGDTIAVGSPLNRSDIGTVDIFTRTGSMDTDSTTHQ